MGPAEIVTKKYNQSVSYANTALSATNAFQSALAASVYSPPQISVQWTSLAPPALTPIPNAPALPNLDTDEPSGMPASGLGFTPPSVSFDTFSGTAPTLDLPSAPTMTIGSAPVIPEPNAVPVPSAPTVALPSLPTFMSLTTHTFNGIDLHEGWLDKLEDIPALHIVEPAPFDYRPGPRYASQLLDNLKASLNARIHGGTGLPTEVEQQIWDRARDRETQIALAREQEVLRGAEALGFPLPSGVLAGQLADARREYHEKLSGLSRDIAIKQAELEQQNIQNATQAAIQLESTLLEDCYKLEMLAFTAAKEVADNAIAANNAAIEHFKALLTGYQAYASVYDTMIKAELAKVEAFKALLSAEETKANINKSLVDRYKAEIDGRLAQVEVYKAQVGAAQTLMEVERTRIQVGGERVRAFVAQVNAETAKAELYRAQIGGETAKVEAYSSEVRAFAAKVGAQAEQARVGIAQYEANMHAKALEWDGWKAKLQAATTVAELKAKHASITVDGYRAAAAAAEAQAGANARLWESNIRQYQAGRELTFQVAKANNDATIHAKDARMEAAKVGLTTSAQQLASAWAMVGASAQIIGQDQTTRTI